MHQVPAIFDIVMSVQNGKNERSQALQALANIPDTTMKEEWARGEADKARPLGHLMVPASTPSGHVFSHLQI
jgi:hypothetical protein